MFLFFYYIFSLIIQKITCECFERCKNCSSIGNYIFQQLCDSCITDTYLMENSQNCFYIYEQPNYYIDDNSQQMKKCPAPCYECSDNSISNCISCLRGYYYNKEEKKCIECPSNEYIYIFDGIEKCKNNDNNGNNLYCQLKITQCSGINTSIDIECPRENPLLIKNSNKKECALEYYSNNNDYEISNKIIKTQWLNNIINIGEGCSYLSSAFDSKGDLIMEANLYSHYVKGERYFYGIQYNGRPLFYDHDKNTFYYEKKMNFENDQFLKFDSQLINIKLYNEPEKEYYLSIAFNYITTTSIELADINNSIITGIPHSNLFNYSWNSIVFSIIELKKEGNIYLFCYTEHIGSNNYISFKKIKFNKSNISEENSFEILQYKNFKGEVGSSITRSFTCIQIISFNIIQCFYIDILGFYKVGLFDENSLELINTFLIDIIPINILVDGELKNFYQCIHFKKEISILGYTNDLNSDLLFIQMKEIIYKYSKYKLEDYFLRTIVVNSHKKFTLHSDFYTTSLQKLNDNEFSLTILNRSKRELYIILFTIYNFHETNLFIRYYNIPLKLYNIRVLNSVISFNFNGFLGIGISSQQLTNDLMSEYFIIFNYINSTDSELITLETNTVITLSDFINNTLIENNLFGFIFYGIKLLKLPNCNEIGVYYLSYINKNILYENDILSENEQIVFAYDYNNLVKNGSIYTIEIVGVIQEPSYSELNQYPIYAEYIGNEDRETFYQPNLYIGKTSFINFTIQNNLTKINDNSCNNCKICYNDTCIKCNDNYYLKIDSNNCININIDGYYFDKEKEIYKKCHEVCKTCSNSPIYFYNNLEIEDTNCDICIDNYYKVINTNNCIYKDTILLGYYLDSDKKLFMNCYEKCKTCIGYKINTTSLNCLSCDENSIYYEYSHNCLDCALRDKFVNYYHYDCLDFIPDGYYLLNEEKRIIDKCYITCKHCNETGNENNHKCTECADAYPYNYNNGEKCLDDCSKESLYLDQEEKICYMNCQNNINNKKNKYKNFCIDSQIMPKNYKLDNNIFESICDPKTEYEFNNECYNSCPEGTQLDKSFINKNVCKCNNLYYLNDEEIHCINSNICPDEYPYLKINTSECSKCPLTYKGKCYTSCPENTCITQINKNLATCIEQLDEYKTISNICFEDFLVILDRIEELNFNNNYIINNYEGVTVNLYEIGTDINNMKSQYENLTFIDLNECQNLLREFYNLSYNEALYILSIDYLSKISTNPTNSFNFEIYLKNKTKLEHNNICNNIVITVSSPIMNLELVNFEKAEIFNSQGYDIYNLSSNFYNDKCTPAYINGNDIIIKDRIEEIYPFNASLCPNDCLLNTVEMKTKRLNCSCNISFTLTIDDPNKNGEDKSNMLQNNDDDNLINYMLDSLNYQVFKCSKIFKTLNFKDYIVNIGFILGFSVIIWNLINTFIFFLYFLKKLRINIFKSIPNKQKLIEKVRQSKRKINFKNVKYKRCRSLYSVKVNSKIIKTNKYITKKKIFNMGKSNKNKNGLFGKRKKPFSTRNIVKINFKKSTKHKTIELLLSNEQEKEEDDYNDLPYSQALRLDKRNIFSIYISLVKTKIDLITILFYPEEFSHYSMTISIFLIEFLFNYFMNAFLYTDDIVSEKYHNNGNLEFLTSIMLSITSNIITSIFGWILKILSLYNEYFINMIKTVQKKYLYLIIFIRLYAFIKIKIAFYYIIIFAISIIITIYLFLFCYIYQNSQVSLLINYLLGVIESLLSKLGISLIACLLRHFGLKYRLKYLYRISVYINQNF